MFIGMHATHRGQFETDAELNFEANAIQTARNTAKKSSIDNRALVRPLTGRLKR